MVRRFFFCAELPVHTRLPPQAHPHSTSWCQNPTDVLTSTLVCFECRERPVVRPQPTIQPPPRQQWHQEPAAAQQWHQQQWHQQAPAVAAPRRPIVVKVDTRGVAAGTRVCSSIPWTARGFEVKTSVTPPPPPTHTHSTPPQCRVGVHYMTRVYRLRSICRFRHGRSVDCRCWLSASRTPSPCRRAASPASLSGCRRQ